MIRIGLRENRTAYRPGEDVEGAVLWEFPEAPKAVELQLGWRSVGEGSDFASVIEKVTFANPQPGDTRTFKLRLPEGPYSFRGKLFAINWSLKLMPQPAGETAEVEIIVGPEGRIVAPPPIEAPPKDWKKRS